MSTVVPSIQTMSVLRKNLPCYIMRKERAWGASILNNLGKQYILDLKDCDNDVLDDLDFLRETLASVVHQTQEAPLSESFHQFTPQGVSGLVLANGSHVCIHTWPEYNYAAMDIFTHNESFDLEQASKIIIEKLGSKNPSVTELERGA